RALDSERTGLSFAEQHVARSLLTPDEVRNLHSETELLFIAGQRPIVAFDVETIGLSCHAGRIAKNGSMRPTTFVNR
ncbi:type IV secretory system conjugative DNA transfer family protein, partial [Rhizobium leguminosarum]|uniref:type IV secretory system conjugative DNA transfer family protein n=1 Tax=Rhizobium leguminosarum TaxID=384 RepID=UPI003F976039